MLAKIVAFLLTFSTTATAQDKATGGGSVLILDLFSTERMSLGQLDSCELTYLLAFEDFIYRNGAVTILRGTLSFSGFVDEADKTPAVILKVTAFDVVDEIPKLAPLKFAYLSSNGVSYAGKEFWVGAADDGGVLVGYSFFDTLDLSFLGPISLNITRSSGRSDVSIPVSFGEYSRDVSIQHTSCMSKLLDAITKKYE